MAKVVTSELSNMQLAHVRLQTQKGESISARESQALLSEIDYLRSALTDYNDLTDKMIWFMEREGVLEKWTAGNPNWDALHSSQQREREAMRAALERLVDLLGQKPRGKAQRQKREDEIQEAWVAAVKLLAPDGEVKG